MKIVVTSGYFDPLHVGHLDYLRLSKELGDKLIVIVNNNNQALIKHGPDFKPFMPIEERKKILEAIGYVDEVFISIDTDRAVCESIRTIAEKHPDCKIIFTNGGDRKKDGSVEEGKWADIPESRICREIGAEIVEGVGNKIQSSSELIKNFYDENGEEVS